MGKITKKMEKKIDTLSFKWKITIPAEDVEEEIKNQLKQIQTKVRVDGFRQGNAPLDILDKKYGEDAMYRAVNTLINRTINEIVKDEGYEMSMAPNVALKEDIKRGKNVECNIDFVLKPKVPDIKYDKIEFDVYELKLSEKDKQKEIDNFRNKMAKQKLVEVEKNVETGDMVDIDFVGRTASDNVEFSGGSAKGYKLEIGSHSFIEGFEEQIIGHKKGDEFDVNVKFPDEYHSSELKGKEAIFSIKINDIYTKELPELTDEFAKTIGFDNIEEVKKLLFDNLKNVYESNMKYLIKDELFETIIEKNSFDLPDSIIDKEIEDRISEAKRRYEQDGKTFDEKAERKLATEGIRKSYASFYLTDSIAEKNNITVSKEDVEQVAMQDAIRNGMDIKEVQERLKKDTQMYNYIAFTIKETKVFEFIYDKIKKNITSLDKEAFEKYLNSKREERAKKNERKKKK